MHATLPQLGEDGEPELGTFSGGEPHTENVLGAIRLYAHGKVNALVCHHALVADFDHESVEINHQVHRLKGAHLPGANLVDHGFRDVTDKLRTDVDAVGFLDVGLNVPRAHAPGVHGQNLLVETLNATLVLLNEAGLEAAFPVARDNGFDLAQFPAEGFDAMAIAPIALPFRRLLALFVAQVRGHLHLHRPIHHSADQLLEQPVGAEEIFRPSVAGQ